MVVEQHLLPYFTWLIYGGQNDIGALPRFLITVFAAAVIALVIGYLVALVRYGPLYFPPDQTVVYPFHIFPQNT